VGALFSGVRRLARRRHEAGRAMAAGLGGSVAQFARALRDVAAVFAIVVVAYIAATEICGAVGRGPTLPTPSLLLALTCALSAIFIPIYYAATRDGHARTWAAIRRKLDSRSTPDSGYFTHRVELQTDRRKAIFLEQFLNIPRERSEILLVLRQCRKRSAKSKNRPYHMHDMTEQIQALLDSDTLAVARDKIKWVCFATRRGEFVAYQDFEVFVFNFIFGKKKEYEDILNIDAIDSFRERIARHRYDEWDSKAGYDNPSTIFGLQFDAVVEGRTKREILANLIDDKSGHRMLVSRDRLPVGVVSIQTLVRDVLLSEIAPPPPAASQEPASGATAQEASNAADDLSVYEAEDVDDLPAAEEAASGGTASISYADMRDVANLPPDHVEFTPASASEAVMDVHGPGEMAA
jgi:hypothetical protein